MMCAALALQMADQSLDHGKFIFIGWDSNLTGETLGRGLKADELNFAYRPIDSKGWDSDHSVGKWMHLTRVSSDETPLPRVYSGNNFFLWGVAIGYRAEPFQLVLQTPVLNRDGEPRSRLTSQKSANYHQDPASLVLTNLSQPGDAWTTTYLSNKECCISGTQSAVFTRIRALLPSCRLQPLIWFLVPCKCLARVRLRALVTEKT
ncbi:hypothetical protein BDD12DRAFT_394658 [Trichophaea hybrida]|nr:hypothetical protein BDD12DRAFT_394658 [Trichophaea hybrida]